VLVHRDAGCCFSCGERLGGRGREGHARPLRRDWEPERGGLILTLGIISLVCLGVCGPAGMVLGITAWAMGSIDLRKMRAGQMDPQGQGLTQGGWVCGILGTALNTLWTLGCAGFFAFVAYEANNPPTRPAWPPPQPPGQQQPWNPP
jgi:hypothetical protein